MTQPNALLDCLPAPKVDVYRFLSLLILSSSLHAARAPDYISFATGVFNILRVHKESWEFEMEYKFLLSRLKSPVHFLELRPLVGVMATLQGASYLYAGINFDLFLSSHLIVVPGFAVGWYHQGQGKNLGYPVEFRSGVEVAWQFDDFRRLGIHFYHLSNAGISKKNPGEESLVLFYDIPLRRGFPFK